MRTRNVTAKVSLLISVLALSVQFAWSQSVVVSPASSNVTAGGSAFDVTVQISGVSNLQASHVEFTFDKTLVQYNGVTRGSVMNGVDDVFKVVPAPGPSVDKVTVDQAVIGATPADGDGSLFTISFIPLKGGTSAIDLTVTLRDPMNNTIVASTVDGTVNIVNPVPTLTSIAPTTKAVGDAGFTLTVNGTNFISGASTVNLNGNSRTTAYVSATQLTATIPATDLLSAGPRSITVVNSAPGGGTSTSQTLTVNKALTSTTVNSSISPSDSSASVTFTATVTPSAATGSVEFFDGLVSLGTSALSGGAATFPTASLAPGTHTIKAVYNGDANYTGSEGTTSQEVSPIITASQGPNGLVDPTGAVVISLGGNRTYNIVPDLHYHVADVLVDGVSVGAVTSYTFTNVTRNRSISATFAINTYTLIVNTVGDGSVTKVPDQATYNDGSTVQLTATAQPGFTFTGWSGGATGTENPLTVTMDANKTITATFSGNTYTVTVSGEHGMVAKDPDKPNYVFNESVNLTASPATGYHFVNWSGDATGTDNPLTITVTGNKNITANFAINSYTLTVNTVGQGSVAKAPDQTTYEHGTVVQLTATPNPGWAFAGWSGAATGAVSPVNVTMDGNKTVTAAFTANAYTVNITAVNGTVTKNPDQATYGWGEDVQLTATPGTGYSFGSWSGDATGTNNPVTITINGNKNVTANFTINNYPLTTTVVGTGTITRNPNQASYDYSTSVQLTANPGTGYSFTGWSGDLTGATNPATVLMTGPRSVTATFAINTFTITVTAGAHGTITPAGPTTVNYGATQHYAIAPDPGYHIVDVKVDNVSQGAITVYDFENVTANHSIEASFAINSYTIAVSAGSNGTVAPAGPNVPVNHGENQLFTFTPAPGYHVATLTIDGVRINPQPTYTFFNVTGSHSIGVTFALDNYAITGPAEYNLDVDGNSVIDMKVLLQAKPVGDATISAIAYVTPPAGQPAIPPDGLPFYLVVNSTLPENQFAATVRLDLNGIAGFGPTSSLAYYSDLTSQWILVDGSYLASDPVFSGHPSFTFQTDHFTPFVFFTPSIPPVHLYGSNAPELATQGAVYPNNSWRPSGPTYTGADDWGWSGTQTVSVYLVPEPGALFGSADITLSWDAAQLTFSGADFGAAPHGLYGSGHAYTPVTTVTTPYGPGKVRIQCTRTDLGNFTTVSGQYIAQVNFTLLKPGHTPVAIIGADFEILQGNQKPYLIPMQAEVKTYLADIAAPGDVNTGDGKVDFEDLVEWSYSYWAGVPGYTGPATYKVKFDLGPTADNYIFSLPQLDGKIDFEDLLIFSIGYGQTAGHYLPKTAIASSQPVEISLGAPIARNNEVDIPVILGGGVTDVRGLKLEFSGQYGTFLGVEKGELLKGYSTPVPLLHRAEARSVYLDLAVMGLDASAIDRPGEVAILRFAGAPRIQLSAFEGRGSRNVPLEMKKVKGGGETQPTEFALLQNYPNPFNPSTTIEYQLPAQAMTEIAIYNMLGERVATLVHEMQPAGFYTVKWNGNNDSGAKVATGVYLYRMRAGDFTLVKKMLLVK